MHFHDDLTRYGRRAWELCEGLYCEVPMSMSAVRLERADVSGAGRKRALKQRVLTNRLSRRLESKNSRKKGKFLRYGNRASTPSRVSAGRRSPRREPMTSLAKFACAFVLAGGLAAPALAAQGDAGSGPTTGATSAKDAGAGPTQGAASKPGSMGESVNQNGQSGMNAEQGATTGANMLSPRSCARTSARPGSPTSPSCRLPSWCARRIRGQPGDDGHQPRFHDDDHRGNAGLQFRQQFQSYGREQQ